VLVLDGDRETVDDEVGVCVVDCVPVPETDEDSEFRVFDDVCVGVPVPVRVGVRVGEGVPEPVLVADEDGH
jgi:hypothetical protein